MADTGTGPILYYYQNTIYVSIYAKKAGVWTKMQDYTVYADNGSYTNGGSRTFSWSVDDTFQLGSNVQAFGVTVSGTDIGSATLTSFSHAKWQAQGSSGGMRSATPNGELSTVTVRPV